ncbi:MAG: hypothetical protein HRT77_04655 [Halioglobus sp.]|nr:hypothetical protein [Halioglobus sp.]
MIIRGVSLLSRLAVSFAVLFAVTACGGGGGGGNDPFFNPPDDDVGIDIALLNAAGDRTTSVTVGSPGTVAVFIRKGGANIRVEGTTTLGTLSPSSALTDGNSRAIFTLFAPDDGLRDSGTVTVTATAGEATLSGTLNFEVGQSGLRLGYFDADGEFIEGAIGVSPDTTVAPRGRAQLSLAVVDKDGALINTVEQVLFSSGCLSSGLSALDSANPLATVNGQVSTVYRAEGCSGIDEISATVVGAQAQAFGQLDVAPPEAAGLQFVEANPTNISIRGTGGVTQRPETSDVFFRVVDSNGSPVQGAQVDFELTLTESGASVSPASAISTSDGLAFTTVTAGEVGARIRVIATLALEDGVEVSNISDAISISSGLPVQNGISVSVESGQGFVVENGMTQDGIARIIKVSMVDTSGQPVPNGTEARFETEFGTIDQVCRTGAQNGARVVSTDLPGVGTCNVLWTSGNPREPANPENQAAVQTTLSSNSSYNCPSHNGNAGACPNDLGYTRGGRSTILVYGIGEEVFFDSNNNAIMDPQERDDFDNLPEAFLDKNEDGFYTPKLCEDGGGTAAQCLAGSEETFIDFNLNGVYDLNNNPALYNGFACPPAGNGVYCSREPVNVRTETLLILSAPDLGASELWNITVARGSLIQNSIDQASAYKVYISDLYNSRPPAGSTVTLSSAGGCSVDGNASFTVGNTKDTGSFTIDLVTVPSLVRPEDPGEVTITLNPTDGSSYSRSIACTSRCGETPPPDYCPEPPDPNDP